ncbi:MAG: SGNH/GDSL hydrolase family protein [Clostridiales bacterium]|nr:SGNH/GDSL hydrolase family protein [Clostridiales bacterium]
MVRATMGKGLKTSLISVGAVAVLGVLTGGYLLLGFRGYMHKGNGGEYALSKVTPLATSPLQGKNIAFLGSSVTEGARSKVVSFVDYLSKRNGFTFVKEAVSGTTLVDNGKSSYVSRMLAKLDPAAHFDLLVCQLSTNDATKGLPLGSVSASSSLDDFDTQTIIGAMEYVICYTQSTWACPVAFYTGTEFDNALYIQMIAALYELEAKWGIHVIDLWKNLNVNIPEYDTYMVDSIHPSQAGYLKWWSPFIEQELYKIMSKN